MQFEYIKLGIARLVDTHDPEVSHPIEGNYIFGVKLKVPNDKGRVLGLIQENPYAPGVWRAVMATADTFPPVVFERGLWDMTPGRTGFKTMRAAALWMLGAYDARQAWFKAGE
jgi:hypothetical protein